MHTLNAHRRDRWGVVEVVGVFCLLELAFWGIRISPMGQSQRQIPFWSYASHVLMMAVPLAVLCLRRRRPADFGLTLRSAHRDLFWALLLFVAIALPLAVAHLCGWLMLKPAPQRLPMVEAIIFQSVFVAFGEEVLYRGYFQARLNDCLGRRWRVRAIRFGPGLAVAAGLFGLCHLLNPFNPFSGRLRLDWGAFAITSIGGLYLGLLREATGTLIAPIVVHFAWNLWLLYFRVTPAFCVADGIGYAMAWFLLFLIPPIETLTSRK